jgi:DNA repair protein RAD50
MLGSQHDMADGMRRMFEPFEKVARANHVCPCCERPFTPQEEDDFVRKVLGVVYGLQLYQNFQACN